MMASLSDILASGLDGTPHPLFPGAVAIQLHDGKVACTAAVGDAVRYGRPGPDKSAGPLDEYPVDQRTVMTTDTVFDLASITKVFTTVVVMTLVEEGLFNLDEPIAAHLPSFAGGNRRQVTLRGLLTHTSGLALPPLLQLWTDWPDRDSRVQAVLNTPLVAEPGSKFLYSCYNFILAGLLAEEVSGRSLVDLVTERVLIPLKLSDTGYLPAPDLKRRIAATEYQPCVGRGVVHGDVHDVNSWSLGGAAGNAGIFSTAGDVARLGEMLRLGGVLDDARILTEESVLEMTRDQLPSDIDPGWRQGLGVRIAAPSWMGSLAADEAFGHTGSSGTALIVDQVRRLTIVLLTNRVHPSREWSDVDAIRARVCDWAVKI